MVFQDPYTSLNPAMTVEDILTEPLLVTGTLPRGRATGGCGPCSTRCTCPPTPASACPGSSPAGSASAIAIARALSRDPKLIVCDEPVSALDLSTQARVLDLFIEIQQRTGVAYLFITHDLSVVRHISHRVAVMYRGELVETGDAARRHHHAPARLHPAAAAGRTRARPASPGGAPRRAAPPRRPPDGGTLRRS